MKKNTIRKIRPIEIKVSLFINPFLSLIFQYLVQRQIILVDKKPIENYTYLSITNKGGLKLLKYSLISLLKASEKIPSKVVIVSDGSWNVGETEDDFNFWPSEIVFESWHESAIYHQKKGNESLYIYATKQIWGKKLAAILRYSELGPTIYADTDVLWFNSPFERLERGEETALQLTIDNSYNYDNTLLCKLGREDILEKLPINCGIVYAKGDLFKKSSILESAINIESKSPGSFSEQTILALLTYEFGSTWDFETITSRIDDSLWPIIPNYKDQYKHYIARHYVWAMKWLFWRDFLYLNKREKIIKRKHKESPILAPR